MQREHKRIIHEMQLKFTERNNTLVKAYDQMKSQKRAAMDIAQNCTREVTRLQTLLTIKKSEDPLHNSASSLSMPSQESRVASTASAAASSNRAGGVDEVGQSSEGERQASESHSSDEDEKENCENIMLGGKTVPKLRFKLQARASQSARKLPAQGQGSMQLEEIPEDKTVILRPHPLRRGSDDTPDFASSCGDDLTQAQTPQGGKKATSEKTDSIHVQPTMTQTSVEARRDPVPKGGVRKAQCSDLHAESVMDGASAKQNLQQDTSSLKRKRDKTEHDECGFQGKAPDADGLAENTKSCDATAKQQKIDKDKGQNEGKGADALPTMLDSAHREEEDQEACGRIFPEARREVQQERADLNQGFSENPASLETPDAATRQLRRRQSIVSYTEPSLNKKMRQGDEGTFNIGYDPGIKRKTLKESYQDKKARRSSSVLPDGLVGAAKGS